MKHRLFSLVSIVLAIGMTVSCTNKEDAPVELQLSGKSGAIVNKGGEVSVDVTSNSEWKVTTTADWFTYSPAGGTGNGTITIKANANVAPAGSAASSRSATLTVTAKDKSVPYTVTQAGETVVFTVTGATAQLPEAGGTVKVQVEHNVSYETVIQEGVDWITKLETKSVITDNLSFAVAANEGQARSAIIYFRSESQQKEVTVNQDAASYKPSFSGKGTASEPYAISTSAQLEEFSFVTNSSDFYTQFSDKYFVLTADLDMSGLSAYTPAAQNVNTPFKGVFDGASHSITALKIANEKSAAAGLFAYADGATIKNIKLVNADIDSKYVYCGSIVGYAKNGCVIQNVSVSGKVREYVSGITIDGIANSGLSGGLVGTLDSSTLTGGTVDANVTFYGKFSGGVVGYANNSTVSDCHYLKDRVLNIYYHFNGGIVGRARGEQTVISNCSFEATYSATGYVMGGIVGQLFGGKVEKCVLGSHANIGGDKYFVGGIVGTAQPENEIIIDHCACYGELRGAYSVGGIVGYCGLGAVATDIPLATATKPVTIKGCALIGGTITATQGNSNKYPIAGGILGWSHGSNNLTLTGCYSKPGVIQTIYGDNVNNVLSGICSYQNSTGVVNVENCYSSFTPTDMLVCNDPVSDAAKWYAGIVIRCTQPTNVTNNYSHTSLRYIEATNKAVLSGNEQLSDTQMTDGTLLGKLQNNAAAGVVWVKDANNYPTISDLPADPNVKKKAAKLISIIGDSISTFRGWILGGYSSHYPATDGTLTLVNETYWYRLAKDYMKDADISLNIAFSGSTVTNTTEENFKKKYTSEAWWHNSFSERFAKCGGCGHPDIILIHGGTNDWAHNIDPLAPGVAIRNDASNAYGGVKPSATIMNNMYTVADAAKTRAEVNALPDGTFCEAYIKLMCQIRERYPKCKVVCIIGDYLGQSVEQSIIDIADHYGAKTVNLFRVNGFNDLGGYSPSTLINKGRQPNMPKHDYSGDVSGCHPGSQAMKFMAEKIYTEHGTWLEE